jgi:hypothetical protein
MLDPILLRRVTIILSLVVVLFIWPLAFPILAPVGAHYLFFGKTFQYEVYAAAVLFSLTIWLFFVVGFVVLFELSEGFTWRHGINISVRGLLPMFLLFATWGVGLRRLYERFRQRYFPSLI